MPVSIVANASANYAQVGVRMRNDLLGVNTQKLTSGLRVFSAQEDAAALAIGTGLKIENAALKTAMVNAAGGVSMLQIADGALSQISDMLTRMQVLAGQASSGHLDAGARAIVNTEFASLQAEVDRVARGTEFNGIKMLAGSKAFTVGAAADFTLDGIVSPPRFDQTIVTGSQLFRYSYSATTEQLTVRRVDGGVATSQTIDLTALLDSAAGAGQNLKPGQL
ncbi:MAG: flagellin, partial [Proteobacteria bacterium]|nr:flagellin [Pseudomonadota bacterium]